MQSKNLLLWFQYFLGRIDKSTTREQYAWVGLWRDRFREKWLKGFAGIYQIPRNRIAMYMPRLAFVSVCVCPHMYAHGTYVYKRAYRLRDKGVRFQ